MTQATVAVITAADRSMKAVAKAVADLAKVSADLTGLTVISEQLSDDIQQKESQLADLERQFDIDLRTKIAELNVRVLENEDSVLLDLLDKRGLEHISVSDVRQLKNDLAAALQGNDKAVEAAVQTATKELHAMYSAKLAAQESNHRVESANVAAEVSSLRAKNEFLAGEVDQLRKQIEAERQTRLQIAQADATRQGVVVNAGKQ